MSERIEDFASRLGDIKEWGQDYESLYGIVDSLFKGNGRHVRGVVDLPTVEATHKGVDGLIVDIVKGSPAEGGCINMELYISIGTGNDNLRKVYTRLLPSPQDVTVTILEDVGKDEVLQEVVEHLDRETARKSFKNVT